MSITDVLPAAAAAVGVPGFADTIGLPTAQRCVVLLVDGLGERQLREYAADAPFLSSREAVTGVRSEIPSTTATSLTSLGTGCSVGVHGMAGYSMRVPQTGRRLNGLKWDQPLDPEVWQPHPAVLRTAAERGATVAVVNDAKFATSGLTRCSQAGVPFHGYGSTWERHDLVVDACEEAAQSLVYTYESRLDHTGHGAGVGSDKWREVLRGIDADVQRLRQDLPGDALLVVTADHGMINLPDGGRFDVEDHRRLLDDVELLAGEARFRHLYTVPGADAEVAHRWAQALGDRADVRLRSQTQEWFGPLAPEVAGRFGDVLVAAQGDFAVFASRDFAIELKLKGFHGSTSDDETLIPLLLV